MLRYLSTNGIFFGVTYLITVRPEVSKPVLRLSKGTNGRADYALRIQAVSPNSSRPISMRRISEVPAPIS